MAKKKAKTAKKGTCGDGKLGAQSCAPSVAGENETKKAKKLSGKRESFVLEYLIDLNATAAYKRAGYKDSPSAHANVVKLIANDSIQAAIQAGLAERAKRTEITADRVIKELAALALSDIGQIMDFAGAEVRLKPASEIGEEPRRAIASMKVKRYFEGGGDNAREVEVTEFKLWDKLPALVKLGQHLGLFTEKLEVSQATKITFVDDSEEDDDDDDDDDDENDDGEGEETEGKTVLPDNPASA